MGEELELGQLYIKAGDGTYVPFEGIEPIEIVCRDEIDEETYDSLIKEGVIYFSSINSDTDGDSSLSFELESSEAFRKSLKKLSNYLRRHIRHEKRMKEKERRRRLKNGTCSRSV